MVQQIASLCVATAQSVISVLAQYEAHDGTVGLLPSWWYRLYYVYSAATILIVAKLRPDAFPMVEIKRSWDKAMSVLKAHEKFGQSARRCVAALDVLSSRISQHAGQGTGAPPGQGIFDPTDSLRTISEQFGGFVEFPDLELTGLPFDANDLSDLNIHAWEVLNQY